jgi:hypothetical protein
MLISGLTKFTNRLILYKNHKFFCVKEGMSYKPNPSNETELLVNVPNDLASVYTFNNLDRLPLYENFKNSFKYTNAIISPKLNLAILLYLQIPAYQTIYFQPLLLLTLYLFKKYLLSTNFKLVDTINIELLPDGKSILVKNFYGITKLDIAETYLGDTVKLGNTTFIELKNEKIKYSAFICDKGRFLNKDLFAEIFSGNYENVKFNRI